MRVLISGAGIAGLSAAFWLERAGFEPIVLERSPRVRDSGFLISLRATGVRVLERMALRAALDPHVIRFQHSTWLDLRHRPIKTFAQDQPDKLFVNRRDLQQVLLDAIAPRVEIRYGRGVRRVAQDAAGVEVELEGGGRERGELLVAADGVGSAVRAQVFGGGHERSLGAAYFAFAIDNRILDPGEAVRGSVSQRVPGACAGSGACSPSGDQIGAYFVYRARPFVAVPPAERAQFLRERFSAFSPHHRSILDSLRPGDPILHDELTQVRLPVWHAGRVVLAGDGAHSLTLLSGMGASLAMAGGYLLGKYLRDSPRDHAAAFARYQARLAGHAARLQRMARNLARLILDPNRITHHLMNTVIRMVPGRTSARRLGKETRTVLDLD